MVGGCGVRAKRGTSSQGLADNGSASGGSSGHVALALALRMESCAARVL